MSNDNPREGTQAIATQSADGASTTAITTPAEFSRRMSLWQGQNYHVLSPVAQLADLPRQFVITPTLVLINPDPRGGEVYEDRLFCDAGEVAIAKPGLAKIALAAGMSIRTERTDPRTIPHYWEVRATARFVGIDGTVQEMDATAEYDLRDGSPRINKIVTAATKKKRDPTQQIEGARQYGLRGCEARAINAVIRQYGIRQKYTQRDLEKPFVVVRVRYEPDMSDPMQAQAVTQARLAGTSLLFGQAARALPPAPTTPEPIDVIGVGGSNDRPAEPVMPTPRTVISVQHDMEAGLYEVTLDGGEVLQTRSADLATALLDAKKTNRQILPDIDGDQLQGLRLANHAEAPRAEATGAQTRQGEAAGGVVVAKVHRIEQIREGKRNDGSTWRHRKITTDAGDWFTFDDKHAAIAEEALKKAWPVRLVRADENPKYPDQLDVETITLIDPRQGSLLEDAPAGGF